MQLKFERLNSMMKYIALAFFLAISMTLMNVGVNVFLSILAGFVFVVLAIILCFVEMAFETNRMRKLNEKMNTTKDLSGYVEAMKSIEKRTIWQQVKLQAILNQGTGYVNQGEYKQALETLDELEKYTVPVNIRFMEIWNRMFALIELRNYGQVEKLMKKYQKIIQPYADASESIADRLEIYRYITTGDTMMAIEKITESREKCDPEDTDVIDQLDYYEMKLCQATGNHERVEELRKKLRSHKTYPCISKTL